MMRPGRKRLHNPIAKFLTELMGRNDLSKEEICVACHLRYPTLDAVWKKRRVSYPTLKALLYAGFITAEQEKDYEKWILLHRDKKKRA